MSGILLHVMINCEVTAFAQRITHGLTNKVMNQPALLKADLVLGRMHIHVDFTWVNGEVNHKGGLLSTSQHRIIRLTQRVQYQFIAHTATINKTVLAVIAAAKLASVAQPGFELNRRVVTLGVDSLLHKLLSAHLPDSYRQIVRAGKTLGDLAIVAQHKRDVRAAKGNAFDHLFNVLIFGFFSAQKLTAGRRIVENIHHVNGCAVRVGRRLDLHCHITPFTTRLPGLLLRCWFRRQRQTAYCRNTGKRLTAKT